MLLGPDVDNTNVACGTVFETDRPEKGRRLTRTRSELSTNSKWQSANNRPFARSTGWLSRLKPLLRW